MLEYTSFAPLSPEAEQVLKARYYKNGETSWSEVVDRVCRHMYVDDKKTHDMLLHRYMLPNTPTLVNSGRSDAGLSACYVLDMEDSIEDIYRVKKDVALIARAGGGVGISLSRLRPEGSNVRGSAHEIAGGPVAFANTISVDADTLTQGGSLRPMALMFVMHVSHPDIRKFITAKSEDGVISNANISVMVDDAFMAAATHNLTYDLRFGGKVYESVMARELLNLIATHTHKNGEPGILFERKINSHSPYKYDNNYITATNPCGEIPAPPNGVCNLASLNLAAFVRNGKIDTALLQDATIRSVIFLDKVITYNVYPTKAIQEFVDHYRPIGLGVMGVADMFLKLGVRYGSEQSIVLISYVLDVISDTAEQTSVELGGRLGEPKGCKTLPVPRRNMTVMSIAPTGSISIIAGCSSGVEPVFSPAIYRTNGVGSFFVDHPEAGNPAFVSALNGDPDKVVTPQEHLKMLSAAQRSVDSGVSKTINLPHTATVQDVLDSLLFAWNDPFIKGVAIYRDGSRSGQVLSSADKCPECESPLESDGGCQTCPNCGWSMCSIA